MPRVRVATLNVRNRADRWLARRHLLVEQIMAAEPDLLSLQELSMPIGQGAWLKNQINMRLSGSTKRPYRLFQKRKQHPLYGYLEGIGILTKLPVLYHDAISLGYGGRVALRVNVELNTHQSLDFVAVHLHNVSHDQQAREEQVMTLLSWLNSRRPVPFQVIAGDFNEVPNGLAIQYLKKALYRSAYECRHGHEPLATYPTALVPESDGWAGCLDYIFISRQIKKVISASVFCERPSPEDDTLFPSDHVGLIATLEIGE
ncbi:MAG: endonuclease/exonuclease/phosphatase family protein [Chloroflexi bacterium]|nr:MAG: endonuclease/exonuclease/phosphatase family protein [Chloroflexota bacterium]